MAKNEKKENQQALSFEQAIERLNQIVGKIEQGQVPLADSLEQYENGMNLIQYCRGILQDAEKRIEKISAQSHPAESQDESARPKDAGSGK